MVTPTSGPGFYGVIFASTGFVTGAGTVEYLLGFTWDSIPIRGLGDDLAPPYQREYRNRRLRGDCLLRDLLFGDCDQRDCQPWSP
jgi:hypothetical protein